ncbi:MAG: hypothetical protein ACRDHX_00645 [Chloroflexota bacterium]
MDPPLSCVYKSTRLKQYFKEQRALRTETVISDTRDFGIGRRVNRHNWQALRAVGDNANRRLCDVQATDAWPAPDVATFAQVTQPSTTADGLQAPSLRFGDPRVMALLSALLGFCHLFAGFTNQQLVHLVSTLLDAPYTTRQATYDLRRLRRKGLIQRLPQRSATTLLRWAGGSPSCSPRPTAAFSAPASSCSTWRSIRHLALAAPSTSRGVTSTTPWTTSLTTACWPRPKLDSFVNFALSKWN